MATSLHFFCSFTKAIKLANEGLLEQMVRGQCPPIPLNEFDKRVVEVIPVHNFLLGVDDGTSRSLRLYCPTVPGPSFVQQGAPDTHIKICGETVIEALGEWLSPAEKVCEQLSAVGILVLPERQIVAAFMAIGEALEG
jgi:hypothetical protein